METSFLLDKIKQLADTLSEDGSTFTRSDLAWDLKDDLKQPFLHPRGGIYDTCIGGSRRH